MRNLLPQKRRRSCWLVRTQVSVFHSLSFIDLKQHVQLVEKAVSQFDKRYATRCLRSNASLRKRLTNDVLVQAIEKFLAEGGLYS
jgi:hypothetical protein